LKGSNRIVVLEKGVRTAKRGISFIRKTGRTEDVRIEEYL